jgi:hypothetical protein
VQLIVGFPIQVLGRTVLLINENANRFGPFKKVPAEMGKTTQAIPSAAIFGIDVNSFKIDDFRCF